MGGIHHLDLVVSHLERSRASYDYIHGYYAVLFYDPDGIKLEIVNHPDDAAVTAAIIDLSARVARLEGR
jgi:catechol 2,3-dioxygenase-like lactoylglutathione lyase family enzyme